MKTEILQLCLAWSFLVGCRQSDKSILAPEIIFEPGDLHVITSGFNRRQNTNFTLYGNALTLNHKDSSLVTLLPGQVFKLVTWKQKPNPYWFGGYINDEILTVEVLKIARSTSRGVHTDYHVENSKKEILHRDDMEQKSRIKFICEQKASVFP